MPPHSLRLFNKIRAEYCCDGILVWKTIHPASMAHIPCQLLCVYFEESNCVSSPRQRLRKEINHCGITGKLHAGGWT